MNKLEKYLNYAFEIYHLNGEFIDKIEGPGDNCAWLYDIDSPLEVAILPVAFEKAVSKIEESLLYRVVSIQLDENLKEIPGKRENIVLFEAENIEVAKNTAKEFNCEYMYWSEWDYDRIIVILDPYSEKNIFVKPHAVYYHDPDSLGD